MEAIILAGGFGTRLKSVINEIPKPMAPINNKPFLSYLLNYLQKNNISRVVLSVGYKGEMIQEFFGDSFGNLELVYSTEDEPLGTGGAIKKALSFCTQDKIFVVNGDTFFDVDLRLIELKEKSKLTLSLKQMENFDRYGCIKTNEIGYVTAFKEKEFTKKGNINAGVYLLSKDIFDKYALENKFSFESFMQENLETLNIGSILFDNYFIDIGIPDDYRKAQEEIV